MHLLKHLEGPSAVLLTLLYITGMYAFRQDDTVEFVNFSRLQEGANTSIKTTGMSEPTKLDDTFRSFGINPRFTETLDDKLSRIVSSNKNLFLKFVGDNKNGHSHTRQRIFTNGMENRRMSVTSSLHRNGDIFMNVLDMGRTISPDTFRKRGIGFPRMNAHSAMMDRRENMITGINDPIDNQIFRRTFPRDTIRANSNILHVRGNFFRSNKRSRSTRHRSDRHKRNIDASNIAIGSYPDRRNNLYPGKQFLEALYIDDIWQSPNLRKLDARISFNQPMKQLSRILSNDNGKLIAEEFGKRNTKTSRNYDSMRSNTHLSERNTVAKIKGISDELYSNEKRFLEATRWKIDNRELSKSLIGVTGVRIISFDHITRLSPGLSVYGRSPLLERLDNVGGIRNHHDLIYRRAISDDLGNRYVKKNINLNFDTNLRILRNNLFNDIESPRRVYQDEPILNLPNIKEQHQVTITRHNLNKRKTFEHRDDYRYKNYLRDNRNLMRYIDDTKHIIRDRFISNTGYPFEQEVKSISDQQLQSKDRVLSSRRFSSRLVQAHGRDNRNLRRNLDNPSERVDRSISDVETRYGYCSTTHYCNSIMKYDNEHVRNERGLKHHYENRNSKFNEFVYNNIGHSKFIQDGNTPSERNRRFLTSVAGNRHPKTISYRSTDENNRDDIRRYIREKNSIDIYIRNSTDSFQSNERNMIDKSTGRTKISRSLVERDGKRTSIKSNTRLIPVRERSNTVSVYTCPYSHNVSKRRFTSNEPVNKRRVIYNESQRSMRDMRDIRLVKRNLDTFIRISRRMINRKSPRLLIDLGAQISLDSARNRIPKQDQSSENRIMDIIGIDERKKTNAPRMSMQENIRGPFYTRISSKQLTRKDIENRTSHRRRMVALRTSLVLENDAVSHTSSLTINKNQHRSISQDKLIQQILLARQLHGFGRKKSITNEVIPYQSVPMYFGMDKKSRQSSIRNVEGAYNRSNKTDKNANRRKTLSTNSYRSLDDRFYYVDNNALVDERFANVIHINRHSCMIPTAYIDAAQIVLSIWVLADLISMGFEKGKLRHSVLDIFSKPPEATMH